MKDDDLIKKIDRAILTEEEGIPIYAKHIDNTLFWSGLDDELKKKITTTLLRLKQESQKHKVLLTHIKQLVSSRN